MPSEPPSPPPSPPSSVVTFIVYGALFALLVLQACGIIRSVVAVRLTPSYWRRGQPQTRERLGAGNAVRTKDCAPRMERLWSLAVATSGNQWQMHKPRNRL
jgi:hypothetical protein